MVKLANVVASSTIFASAACRAANLLVGGGFEDPAIPPGDSYLASVTPSGWVGQGDVVAQAFAGSVPSGEGNQWFDLNPGFGDVGGTIYQEIAFEAGKKYLFSFLYNGGGRGSTTAISFILGAGVDGFVGAVWTTGMDVFSGTPWASFSMTFAPTFTGSELLFIQPNGNRSGGFIDAVSLTAVPEPGAHLLWLGGLGLLGWRALHRTA